MPEGAPLLPSGLGSLSESEREKTCDSEVRQMFSTYSSHIRTRIFACACV